MNISALTSSTNALPEIRQAAATSADRDGRHDQHAVVDAVTSAHHAPPHASASATRPAASVDTYTPAPVSLEPSASRSVALAMFPHADTNHDGKVTLSELIASFNQLDTTS